MHQTVRYLGLSLFLHLCSLTLFAQAPAQLNFQGIARYSNGNIIVAKAIALRFSVRIGSANGAIAYREERRPSTDSNGVFNAVIGSAGGLYVVGSLDTVNWAVGPRFLQVEMDTTANGINFTNLGATQMLSVPYALHSKSSGAYFFEALFTSAASSPFPGVIAFPTTNHNEVNPFTNNLVYNPTTGVFTAPEDGIYQFDVALNSDQNPNVNNLDEVFLTKNGVKLRYVNEEFYDGVGYWHLCCILRLKANDTIRVEIFEETYPPDPNALIGAQSTFSGYKIR